MIASMKKVSGPASCHYYQALDKTDYYAKEQSANGQWLGSGAKELGLSGGIEPNDERLKHLFEGRHPTDPDIVLRQGGNTERVRKDGTVLKPVSAYDFTLSAPKSVSVLWGIGDPEKRASIEVAHRYAFTKASEYLEEKVCVTRRGRGGGGGYEPVKPVMAVFQHGTSRENDPLLHSHLLLINVGQRPDGKWASLDGSRFMSKGAEAITHKVGAIYRDALRERLERDLGLKSETVHLKHGKSFELACVPKEVCQAFSTRRGQIEEKLLPKDTAKQVQVKVLATRKAKDRSTPEHELFASWQERAKELGFSPKQEETPKREVIPASTQNVVPTKSEELTRQQGEPLSSHNQLARDGSFAKDDSATLVEIRTTVAEAMVWSCESHVQRVIASRQQAIDRAFAKARANSEARAKRFKASVAFRYMTGQMSHKTYRRLMGAQPRTKLGIHAAHITGRITRKQRDRLLYTNRHISKEQWLSSKPRSKLGINFAYATHRITEHERLALLWHNGHLRRELESNQLPLLSSVPYRSREALLPLKEYDLNDPVVQKAINAAKAEPRPQPPQHTLIRERERER